MPDLLSTVRYRDVVGFPGYRVGDDGSIWSCRGRRWKTFRKTWLLLKPKLDGRGRTRIQLYIDSEPFTERTGGRMRRKAVTKFVCHLVLEAFVGPRPCGMVACHRNDHAADNRLSNLRWDTPKANAADALRNGRYHLGLTNRNARFTEEQVKEIRRVHAAGVSCISLSRITGASEVAVRKIVSGENWSWLI